MRIVPLAFAATLTALPAAAQNLPPANSLPLSEVVAKVEKTQPVRVFTEIEWEDDGYWDFDFINTDNRRARIRIDPFSGEPWSRRR
ncbi:PepSY domain-containing protein [uncultured Amaricoccus sp.]|uniref:PepSY domain-containing protein n=1 Tax=uncultured Amaricoccus sp. TaxID=339341 RepID=UPI0026220ADF|nr:PepSY domain-containing protein [uncultured Amaricoccus sp.]